MFRVIKGELIKLWSSKITWGYLLFFIFMIGYLSFTGKHKIIPARVSMMPNENPWYILLIFHFSEILIFILISGLLAVTHFQIEHRNSMLKQIRMLPINSFIFFLVKVVALLISVLIFQILYMVIMAVGVYYEGLNYPNFSSHSYLQTLPFQLLLSVRLYLSLWGYLAMISLLNMYVRNTVLAAALIILLWFTNFSRIFNYFPSSFPKRSELWISGHFSATLSYDFSIFEYEFYSLFTFLFILIVAYFLDKKGFLIKV